MKLYATVTSERASKGQGGEWLDIVIQNEQREKIGQVFVQMTHDNLPIIATWGITKVFDFEAQSSIESLVENYTKGNKQKGECNCYVMGKGLCPVHGNE